MREELWEERTPGSHFIGSEGERGGRASEWNGRRWWCTIMVLKEAVFGVELVGEWWGGERAPAVTEAEGGGALGGGSEGMSRQRWQRCRARATGGLK
jgi:hypothetical protein